MKENLKKVVFIIIGFFLTSLFVSQNVFASTTWSDNGVVINSFLYDENNDLVLDFSYNYDYVFIDNSDIRAEKICIRKDYATSGINLKYYNNFGGVSNDYSQVISGLVPLSSGCEETIADYEDFVCVSLGNSCLVKFTKLYSEGYNFLTKTYINKNDLDTYIDTDVLETTIPATGLINDIWGGTYSYIRFIQLYYYNGSYVPVDLSKYVQNSNTFPISSTPPTINGVCGSANGSTFDWADFDNQDFCSTGTYTLNSISSGSITWDCEGSGGGTTESCSANYYINGECGTANGGYFSTSPEVSTLCSSESYLILPSFVETSSGWTWICGGYYGGTQSYCSAYLTGTSYPSLPEEEDCSSYTIPDKWICEIKNIFNGAFLPSEAKLNELNIAINSFQTKAPFNYLSSASNILENVKNGISEDDLSITIMQNTSQVNLNDIEAFTSIIKTFFTILLMFAFLFWGINYIKHFFR